MLEASTVTVTLRCQARLYRDVQTSAGPPVWSDDLQYLFELRLQVDATWFERDVASFQQGEVQTVLRHAQSVASEVLHLLALRQQSGVFLAEDREQGAQRGAELVAERREQLVTLFRMRLVGSLMGQDDAALG